MPKLAKQISEALLPGMVLPAEFTALFKWIESNGFYTDTKAGRIGSLCPEHRSEGTRIEFLAEGNVNVQYWFGRKRSSVLDRLCVFANTGAEGSNAAFWIDDDGKQCIVHMGSGSGSLLCCVLAETAIDFLRLIAIGYEEICWNQAFAFPPNSPEYDSGTTVRPNRAYQDWVRTTYGVTIPRTALKIVKHPAQMGDKSSPDRFCRWVEENSG
jgi:hypothetical protein